MAGRRRQQRDRTVVVAIVTGAFLLVGTLVGAYINRGTELLKANSGKHDNGSSVSQSVHVVLPEAKSGPVKTEGRLRQTAAEAQAKPSSNQTGDQKPQSGVVVNGPVSGSVVVSQGQQGGQTAQTIQNIFNPPSGTPSPTVPLTTGEPCPKKDPTDPARPAVDVGVDYWCQGSVFELDGSLVGNHVQIKIRPRFINNSQRVVSIGIGNPSPIRLLVTAKDIAGRWMPPPLTRAAGDQPRLIEWEGQSYWGIPPNQPRDARATPLGYYTGFATVWDGTTLAPGESYIKPRRERPQGGGVREGDLVFQVPIDREQVLLAGLALVEFQPNGSAKVLGFARRSEWPPSVDPNEF